MGLDFFVINQLENTFWCSSQPRKILGLQRRCFSFDQSFNLLTSWAAHQHIPLSVPWRYRRRREYERIAIWSSALKPECSTKRSIRVWRVRCQKSGGTPFLWNHRSYLRIFCWEKTQRRKQLNKIHSKLLLCRILASFLVSSNFIRSELLWENRRSAKRSIENSMSSWWLERNKSGALEMHQCYQLLWNRNKPLWPSLILWHLQWLFQ